jgi:hypothetical protein
VSTIAPTTITVSFWAGLDGAKKECSSCDIKPTPPKRKPPPEQEAATSTTPGDTSNSESPLASLNKIPTPEWGIEEVIQFIESADSCLGVHADLFRKHVSRLVK